MKRAAIILAIIIAVALAGLFAKNKLRAAGPEDKTQYKIAKTSIGEVKKTVSATGTLQPWTTVDIKSKAGGKVLALLVDVGTVVRKGDVIARIDPADTQLSVDQAKADIDSADAKIRQSNQTWDLQKHQSALNVAAAQASVLAARANLNAAIARRLTAKQQMQAQPDLTKSAIAMAKANLDNAQKQLAQLKDATNPQEHAAAQAAYDEAVANASNAQANLTRQKNLLAKGFVSQQVVDQAQATYEVSKAQVATAKQKLDTIETEQQSAVEAAQARVQQANAQYQNAQAGKVDEDVRKSNFLEAEASVKQYQAQLRNAEKALELAKANTANNAIRYSDVMQAEAQKARAQASYTNASNTLAQCTVTAPSDGVVLKKYVEQGTIITSGLSLASTGTSIVQLGETDKQYVDVTVDETDIANVDEKQAVDVSVEAYPGVPVEGKVARIDPQAVVEQNVTTFHVRVEIDNTSPTFKLLKPGMNATCQFVIDKKEDVLSVPNEAIRNDDQGKFVEIAIGGKPAPADAKTGTPADPNTLVDVKPKKVRIETGLEGNDATEVTSGLKDGDTIITQTIEPVPQTAGGAIGGGFPGMRGAGGGGRR